MAVIRIEVAYALPDRQEIIALEVEENCSVLDAVQRSGIARIFSAADGAELDLSNARFGIFSRPIEQPAQHALRAGDRIEIYRPLLIDPKVVRRERAESKVRIGNRPRKKPADS